MQQSLVKYIEELKDTTIQKASIERDLSIASDIQMGMLPVKFPIKEDRDDVQLYASLTPAKAVGGDLFDFYFRDEKLFFCIGDVSGKGVVTLFVGVLDLPTGRLHYCNAGHDAPLLVGAGVGELSCDANIPVGFMPQWKYTLQEAHIFTGTTIFLFTDGLTEAEDINHAQFQMERVHEVAGQALAQQMQEPKELIGSMAEAVHQFVGDAEQSDDLTMMAIQYIKQQHDVKLRKSIVLPNDVEEVSKLTAFVEEVCEAMGFDGALTAQLTLAIEEAVVNVMKYAYPPQKRGDVTIEAQSNDLRLKFTIIDSGMPFDPTVRAEVDTTLSAEDRPIGGLGIHLVRKIMDSINYERVDSLNVLTLRKKLNNKKRNGNNHSKTRRQHGCHSEGTPRYRCCPRY